MGTRLLVIPRSQLADFFRIKGTVLMEGLPADAEILACSSEAAMATDEIVFKVQSKEWKDTDIGYPMDQVRPTITRANPYLSFRILFRDYCRSHGLTEAQMEQCWQEGGYEGVPATELENLYSDNPPAEPNTEDDDLARAAGWTVMPDGSLVGMAQGPTGVDGPGSCSAGPVGPAGLPGATGLGSCGCSSGLEGPTGPPGPTTNGCPHCGYVGPTGPCCTFTAERIAAGDRRSHVFIDDRGIGLIGLLPVGIPNELLTDYRLPKELLANVNNSNSSSLTAQEQQPKNPFYREGE